jgi:hypothetical protein
LNPKISGGKIKEMNNYAFIDGNNLYLGVRSQGWKLDYKKNKK